MGVPALGLLDTIFKSLWHIVNPNNHATQASGSEQNEATAYKLA
jgi:hypothetical protein